MGPASAVERQSVTAKQRGGEACSPPAHPLGVARASWGRHPLTAARQGVEIASVLQLGLTSLCGSTKKHVHCPAGSSGECETLGRSAQVTQHRPRDAGGSTEGEKRNCQCWVRLPSGSRSWPQKESMHAVHHHLLPFTCRGTHRQTSGQTAGSGPPASARPPRPPPMPGPRPRSTEGRAAPGPPTPRCTRKGV